MFFNCMYFCAWCAFDLHVFVLLIWRNKDVGPICSMYACGVSSPKGVTSFPDRGSYEYDEIRVSLCLLCLVV